jgi:periodic tryptophan protein 2
MDVHFSPDGRQVAAVTLDCQVTWFEWRDAAQSGSVEGRLDLEPGRGKKDQITAKKSGVSKYVVPDFDSLVDCVIVDR